MPKFSVTIYPNGVEKNAVELLFDSQEDHSAYVRNEANYCRKEQSEYLAELYNKADRISKKNRFYQKRTEFAKKSGFVAVNNTQWKRKAKNVHSGGSPLGVA